MRILSDFDGVLTDQIEEGHRVRELFEQKLSKLGSLPIAQVSKLFKDADAAMDREFHRHGWKVKGRITAFANEDLFIQNNGLAACLDEWAAQGQPMSRELLSALKKHGVQDFVGLAQIAYEEMVRETQAGQMKPIDPETPRVIGGLLEAGHEVVVVSNSGTTRIIDLFARSGLKAVAHDEDPKAKFRVRGGARKYELSDESAGFSIGEYFVEVARPVYEMIIREERPQAVIGDVFSLDLALPYHLARTEESFRGMQLFLRTRSYTPKWSADFVARSGDASAQFRFLESLPELSGYLRTNV